MFYFQGEETLKHVICSCSCNAELLLLKYEIFAIKISFKSLGSLTYHQSVSKKHSFGTFLSVGQTFGTENISVL